MSEETKVARINGKYTLIAAFIGSIGTIIGTFIGIHYESTKIDNITTVSLSNNEDFKNISTKLNNDDRLNIDKIIAKIENKKEEHNDYFENLKTNVNEIELLYKLFLSEDYEYRTIILALNEYGIDCEKLSINEYLLEMWDIEILYVYCNIENNRDSMENQRYYFNDFKMNSRDKCNYSNFSINYSGETYDSISNDLDEHINNLIKKIKNNS